jgi:serine/threonine protein kinase
MEGVERQPMEIVCFRTLLARLLKLMFQGAMDRIISLPTLFEATSNRYVKEEKLGQGAYGVVYRGLDTVTQNHVAMKFISLMDYNGHIGLAADKLREMGCLKRLSSCRLALK